MLKVLAAGLLLTALYNFLVFNSQPGIGFSLFIVFLNIVILTLKNREAKNPLLSYLFAGVSSLFALLLNFRSNGVIQLVDFVAAVFFLSLNLYFSKTNLRFDFSFLNFFIAPLKTGLNFVEGVVKSFIPETWTHFSSQKHITSSIVRGGLIGLPIIVILFFILSRADPVFENITVTFLEDVWIRTLLSVIVFLCALSLGIMKVFEEEKYKEIKEVSPGKEYELLVILGGLALLFGGFILIQFKYLFSDVGERELLSLGIKSLTYSEYVRKGFLELLLASSIAVGIILYALQYIHKLKDKGKIIVQILSSAVIIEVGLLLWSAAQRVFLYQEDHGLTRARVFGMFFLIWLGIILVILLIKIIKDLNNKTYWGLNIISTLLILISFNFINTDELIATKYRPTVNNEIDYFYLASLSPDAHLAWKPAIKASEQVVLNLKDKQDLNSEDYRVLYRHLNPIYSILNHVNYLIDKYGSIEQVELRHQQQRNGMDKNLEQQTYQGKPLPQDVYTHRKWQSANLGEYLAYVYIRENSEAFNKLPQLLDDLRNIQNRINPEVINNTTLDRSTNPPLSN